MKKYGLTVKIQCNINQLKCFLKNIFAFILKAVQRLLHVICSSAIKILYSIVYCCPLQESHSRPSCEYSLMVVRMQLSLS